jgi:probable rRNA maturation factor
MEETFSITYQTKGKLPSLPFVQMKDAALGKDYVLSVVVVDDETSQRLNNTYRSKDKPTDILSFPLSENEGEMFLNLKYAREKAKEFDRDFDNFIGFLFIHGLIHLKGFDHGDKMEAEEVKLRKRFKI